MAQSLTATLIDDIDQSTASETVRFSVDGTAYEIDLSAKHASELRSVVGRYITVARRIRSAPPRAPQPHQPGMGTKMARPQSPHTRSRAAEGGLVAAPKGRIPQHRVDQYEAATPAAPIRFRPPGTAERKPASNGAATRKPSSRRLTPNRAQDDLAAAKSAATVNAVASADDRVPTDREKQELRNIADAAEPRQNVIADRLRTKGLADRDTAGNWWLTNAGRRELTSGSSDTGWPV